MGRQVGRTGRPPDSRLPAHDLRADPGSIVEEMPEETGVRREAEVWSFRYRRDPAHLRRVTSLCVSDLVDEVEAVFLELLVPRHYWAHPLELLKRCVSD